VKGCFFLKFGVFHVFTGIKFFINKNCPDLSGWLHVIRLGFVPSYPRQIFCHEVKDSLIHKEHVHIIKKGQ